MTRLMEQAIERLRAMPEDRQDQVAHLLLDEVLDHEKWVETTRRYEGKLDKLIGSVKAEELTGRCEPLDPEKI